MPGGTAGDLGSAVPDDYLMDHSSIVYLMGPDGKFIRHFAFGTAADDMASELKKAVEG